MATILKFYVATVSVVSVLALVYVYLMPPQSMLTNRDGVAHFTPPVAHAETGEPVALGDLIRHFQGD